MLSLMLAAFLLPQEVDQITPLPVAWHGSWSGTMINIGAEGPRENVLINIDIQPIAGTREATWVITYGGEDTDSKVVKDYKLVPDRDTFGRFFIDENNGIALDARLVGGVLYSQFETSGTLFTARYELRDEQLRYEVTTARPAAEKTGQSVQGYQVQVVQSALLSRVLPLVAVEDFEDGAAHFEPTDPEAWEVTGPVGDRRYALVRKKSTYQPPVRSPLHIAWLNTVEVSDFVLDLRLRTTHEDYGHRDLCLFFGRQDASHFYYVHLGQEADPHAHSVFLVNGAPRVSIAEERTDGTPWDDRWHQVRIARDTTSGSIEVYFDDMTRPIMKATDRTFTTGRIGLGSFDDTGEFDSVRLRGTRVVQAERDGPQ